VAKKLSGLLRQPDYSTGSAPRIYADGIEHSLELPYALFEDQRSGETLGKLQKVRTDVEKFISAVVNMVFTTLIGLVFRDDLCVAGTLVDCARLSPHSAAIGRIEFRTEPKKSKEVQKHIVRETTALARARRLNLCGISSW